LRFHPVCGSSSLFAACRLQSNVLINDKLEASLADFGTAIILQKSGFTTRTTAGTWRFMAPELMEAEEVHMKVSKATDMYAVAMTYVEVIYLSFSAPCQS